MPTRYNWLTPMFSVPFIVSVGLLVPLPTYQFCTVAKIVFTFEPKVRFTEELLMSMPANCRGVTKEPLPMVKFWSVVALIVTAPPGFLICKPPSVRLELKVKVAALAALTVLSMTPRSPELTAAGLPPVPPVESVQLVFEDRSVVLLALKIFVWP